MHIYVFHSTKIIRLYTIQQITNLALFNNDFCWLKFEVFSFVSLTNVADCQETFVKYLIFQNWKKIPYSQGNLTWKDPNFANIMLYFNDRTYTTSKTTKSKLWGDSKVVYIVSWWAYLIGNIITMLLRI